MAKAPPVPSRMPPPTASECWWRFVKWVLGVPLVVGVVLGVIWLAHWATGSGGMVWKTENQIGTILLYLAFIMLAYPVMVWIWWGDLRAGLTQAKDWEAMTPEAREAAIAEWVAATAKRRSKRKRRAPGRSTGEGGHSD